MDYTNWNTQPTFHYSSELPPIPETEFDDNWCQISQDQNQFLPFNEPQEHRVLDAEATSISNLLEQAQQLQSKVDQMREKTEAQISELNSLMKKWTCDVDRLIVQMLKDIATLDRNYLKLMPWCLQVHEKVTECIEKAEKAESSTSTRAKTA